MPRYIRCFLWVIMGCLAGCSASRPQYGSENGIVQRHLASSREYLLQAGDRVHLIVFQRADLSGAYLIGPDGAIGVPLTGDINISGLSRQQAEKKIHQSLSRHYEPVSILLKITSFQERDFFTVLGEVNKPGAYPIHNQLNLLTALGNAAGMTANADKNRIRLVRKGKKGGTYRINLNRILSSADYSENYIIQKNDVIYVPKSRMSAFSGYFGHLQPIIQYLLLILVTARSF